MTSENTGREQGGQFAKGTSGNPKGKPKGARHKLTLLAESLLAEDATAVIEAVLSAAKEGDIGAARLVLDRIAPLRKGCPVAFDLPPATTPVELLTAFDTLLVAVAEGELTPDEAAQVAALLESKRRAIETAEIEVRLAALEKQAEGAPHG